MKNNKKSIDADLETIIPILIGVWRRLHKLAGPPNLLQTREFRNVVSSVKALQEKSYNGRSLVDKPYFNNSDLLGAYLLYQWPLHYLEGMSLLGELPAKPKRVLDLCSGPAAFSFAAMKHGAQEVIAIDKNNAALTAGAEICGRYGFPLTIRQWDCLRENFSIEGQFDLIILGYCLEELFPDSKKEFEIQQEDFIHKLLNHSLTSNGHLLLIESSHIQMNHRILKLRDRLVSHGVPIHAPCIWKGECPALKSHNSPCYAQREFEKPYLMKEIQRAASINLSSLKMSYIIFRNPQAGWPQLPEKKLYRVISPPLDSFTGKRFYLCGTNGRKNLGSHLEIHPQESRAFEYLRRGELISISNALEKQSALDIIEETVVRIEAACGKSLSYE